MNKILDLTKPLDSEIEIYSEEHYRDPNFSCVEWCSVEKQGYRVSAVTIGTQTGTHIDAPAHFDASGKCLDDLPLENLVGRYFILDLPKNVDEKQAAIISASYKKETILFIRAHASGVSNISTKALNIFLHLLPLVWVLEGEVHIDNSNTLEFHRLIARQGKYLIENLNSAIARQVKPGGELIALPLALVGTSGAPCRVITKQD